MFSIRPKNMVDIANLSTSLQVDGHRSDLVILKTARAHAAFEGRKAITGRDIALAAELAYPHRIKRGPFQQSEISAEELSEKIEELTGGSAEGESEVGEGGEQSSIEIGENGDKKKTLVSSVTETAQMEVPADAGTGDIFEGTPASWVGWRKSSQNWGYH